MAKRRSRKPKQSWCPKELRPSRSAKRLADPLEFSAGERIMAAVWDDLNKPAVGRVPQLARLLHECTDKCSPRGPHVYGDGHCYTKPTPEQAYVANALFQWLGSNVGRGLVREAFSWIDDLARRGHTSSREEWQTAFRAAIRGLIRA